MSKYTNIHFVSAPSLSALVRNSPYERDLHCSEHKCQLIEGSEYPDYNYSDLFRILIAYKYGALYSDLDIVTLKPISTNLPQNFVVADTSSRVGTCLLKFQMGHPFLKNLMQHIVSNIFSYICSILYKRIIIV